MRTMQNNSFDEIRACISRYDNIVLTGHSNPDGDAIGSVLALASALEQSGKKVVVLLESFEKRYDLIPNAHLIGTTEMVQKPYIFISVDCGDEKRFESLADVFDGAECTINFDHHASNTYFAKLNYVEAKASSTCEVVYKFLHGNFPIDQGIASALYAGIVYDTAGFRHSSTSVYTMQVAADLLQYEVPFSAIYAAFFDTKSFSEIKIVGKALLNSEMHFDNRVIVTSITLEEMQAFHSSKGELGSIVNQIKNVENVKIACFLYEKGEKEVKASFRGEDGFNLAKLAEQFGGGGHVKAAGCTLETSLADAKQQVLAEIEKMM